MTEINNGIIKTVRSLSIKKFRDLEGLFVVEGTKCVLDTWGYFKCRWLICTQAWHDNQAVAAMHDRIVIASSRQMSRISKFSKASEVIAVYEQPQDVIDPVEVRDNLNIMLDNVQDPGNLGTILRLADWFGIRHVFASAGTVDVFNHKVVQATMGAISRVHVHYCDLEALLDAHRELPVWGTFLDGDNIYNEELGNRGFVVFGNEGQGISDVIAGKVTRRLYIPSWPHRGSTSESLNVGVAAAITISEFRRKGLSAAMKQQNENMKNG